MCKRITAVLAAVALVIGFAGRADAAEEVVEFTDPGPVSLAGHAPDSVNVGEKVEVGAIELEPGEWDVSASVRLFVADPDPDANDGRGEWKNSQGCGLYLDGEQVGGAGGSSSLWTPTDDGKEVVLDTYLQPPDWEDELTTLSLDEPGGLALVCFIDQSHSGATEEQRASFAATDIRITAVTEVPDPPGGGDGTDDDDDGDDGSADDRAPIADPVAAAPSFTG